MKLTPLLLTLLFLTILLLSACTSAKITNLGTPTIELTQLGGRVKINDPQSGNAIIDLNNEASFANATDTIDKTATKFFGWKVFDRTIDRLNTRDTIEAAATRDAQSASFATLQEQNSHTQQILQIEAANSALTTP